jgi:hypothetical protein
MTSYPHEPSTTHRAVVVYESMFGNTAALAAAVAEGLHEGRVEVTCGMVGSPDLAAPLDADLLVIGAPTHALSLSRPRTRADAVKQGAPPARAEVGLREWLADVEAGPHVPLVATFDTRAAKARRLPAAARTAARLARRRGFEMAGKPAGFTVEDIQGPLSDGEITRAVAWGRALAEELDRRDGPGPTPERTSA